MLNLHVFGAQAVPGIYAVLQQCHAHCASICIIMYKHAACCVVFATQPMLGNCQHSAGTGSSYNLKSKVCVASAGLSNGLGALREC